MEWSSYVPIESNGLFRTSVIWLHISKDITNSEWGLIRHKGFPRAVVHSIEKYVYFSRRDCGENKSESERCPLIKRKIAHDILAKKISYTLWRTPIEIGIGIQTNPCK